MSTHPSILGDLVKPESGETSLDADRDLALPQDGKTSGQARPASSDVERDLAIPPSDNPERADQGGADKL